jgi:hypothetical protein
MIDERMQSFDFAMDVPHDIKRAVKQWLHQQRHAGGCPLERQSSLENEPERLRCDALPLDCRGLARDC